MSELNNKTVFVAGCGGLGCYCIELLVRLGVGKIICADGDKFDSTNMNRQLYCTEKNIGQYKAESAEARWPGKVTGICRDINEKNISRLIENCCLTIDALDSVKARKILADASENAGIPMIHGAIGEKSGQICALFPGDKDILDFLYPSDTVQTPTCSYTASLCASYQIALAEKILNDGEVEHRTLYIFDLENTELNKIKF